MRVLDLARIAAQAEGLRLKALARRQAMRGVWGALAGLFGLFLAIMLHLMVFEFLAPVVGRGWAALIVSGIDLVGAAVFAILAMRNTPSGEEREASRISRQARVQMADSARTFALVTPVARAVGGRGWRGAMVGSMLTQWLTARRR